MMTTVTMGLLQSLGRPGPVGETNMNKPTLSTLAMTLVGALCMQAAFAIADNNIATPPQKTGVTRAQLDGVIAQVRENALLWRNGETVATEPELALKMIFFEKNSVGHLCDVLAGMRLDPNNLYVASRLLRQLTYSRSDTILAALPTVKALRQRAAKLYTPFPKLSKTQVQWLKKPTSRSKAAIEAHKKRQEDKIARETPIARINEAVYSIEGRTFQLMAYSHNPDQYEELADAIVEAEKQHSAVFLIMIQAIGAEARKMSPAEGKALYDILRPVAIELKMERKRRYVNYGRAILRPDNQSTFETIEVYPGITILKTLNRIATSVHSAEAPALKVPKEKEIEKYWARKLKNQKTRKTR